MSYVQRKSLRLTDYDYNANGVYFLTFCTRNKEKLLGNVVGDGDPDVPQVQLSDYGKVVDQYVQSVDRLNYVKLLHYVVMPNHVHMLVQIDTTDLEFTSDGANAAIPRMISVLKRLCNKQIGENIFQRSYHDHVVRNEADFLRIWEYIDTNPQKWNMDKYFMA